VAALSAFAAALALAVAPPAAVERWSAEIAEASARFGLPAVWIRRVMEVESGGLAAPGGRPVVSPKGAMGLMQVMPATWREIRGILGLGSDPYQPRDNILAGSFYLRSMYDRFGYPGLFAAYNAGPARFAAALRGGRPLPAETEAYLDRLGEGLPLAQRTGPGPAPNAAAPGLRYNPSGPIFVVLHAQK